MVHWQRGLERIPLSHAGVFPPLCLRNVLHQAGPVGHCLPGFYRINAKMHASNYGRQDAGFWGDEASR